MKNRLFMTGLAGVLLLFLTPLWGQTQTFNLQYKETPVVQVLEDLESKTNYSFVYQKQVLAGVPDLTCTMNGVTLTQALDEICGLLGLSYEIVHQNIVIRKSDEAASFANLVSGTVTDTQGEPLVGVTVHNTSSGVYATTDANGVYSIKASPRDQITYTCIGMATQSVPVNSRSRINIRMEVDSEVLDEIVVVGYGVQKKSDVTGAVASFNKDLIEERPAPNLVSVLQGSVPGLNVELYGSNAEGSNNSTTIRGSNSINASNAPLIILDGSPYYYSWSELNPDDIESIEVLKDASSAAIYGARGANGVILITTKKGEGSKPRVNYHGYVTLAEAVNLPEMMDGDTFYYYKNIAVGDFTLTERNSFLSHDYVDWVGLALRTGFNQNHNLSVSGKNENNQYYLSFNLTDNQGIAKGDDFKKLSGRFNFEQKLGKWLKFSTNTQYNYVDRSGNNADFAAAYYMNPLAQAYNSDGSLRLVTWESTTDMANPLSPINEINSNIRRSIITNNALDVSFPVKGLTYKLNTNYSYDSRLQQNYAGADTFTGSRNGGELSITNTYAQNWLIENLLNYNREFGKHTIFLTALYSAQHEQTISYSMTGVGFPNDFLSYWQPNKAASLTGSSSENSENHVSQMFRANYSYDSRYLFTATVRRDGFSGFGQGKKYGVFPSVALGWNVTNEPWVKNSAFDRIFNQFKLRLSWGRNGNEAISAYATLPTLSTRNYFEDDMTTSYGYYPTKLESPELGWETTESVNIGLDFGLFKNRIHGTLDVYDARTTDLLLRKTIPSINGATSIWENSGRTHSYGIELGLTSVNVSTRNFSWETALTFFANRTKLVDVGLYDENGNPIDDLASGYFLGWPTNCYYDYVFDGIYQIGQTDENTPLHSKPGYIRYKDLNGDGNITAEADQMVVGSREPKFNASLMNTFRYKGLSLSIYMTGRYGSLSPNYMYSPSRETYNTNTYNRPFWSETNPINEYPSCTRNGVSNPTGMQYYRSADFFKIKDVTLAYRFPEKLVGRLHLNRVEIYANAKNLLTLTRWVGLDPEFVGSSGRQRSIPQIRSCTFGVKLSF